MLARTVELLDDRWTVLVIRDLLLGRRRFSDLERRLGGITAKTLQQRLLDLESHARSPLIASRVAAMSGTN
jgi:DNA-binding HxlR family transcriptional regulator